MPPARAPAATLYVVATPLGNLSDLSPRAAEVLRAVPVVAAEDTRRTRTLLTHLGASPRVLSYHGHSAPRRVETLLDLLGGGRDLALVTDAGTPGISDPGADLVARVRAAGFGVVPLPGPSAVVAALSVAGLPADRFTFLGFLPRRGAERRRLMRRVAESPWPVVLFEAPGRLVELLDDLAAVAGGERAAAVMRELTKVHEEVRVGTLDTLATLWRDAPPKGEITLVVGGREEPRDGSGARDDGTALARRLLAAGMSRRDAVRALVDRLGLPRNEAYRLVRELP
jgi:16S rRNA (cytidine1402-2'-O)-methyltransferase